MAHNLINIAFILGSALGWALFFYLVYHIITSRKQEVNLINSIKKDLDDIKKDLTSVKK